MPLPPMTYLGSWGSYGPSHYLFNFQDCHPFLLETIKTCNSRMFPFQGHDYLRTQPSFHFAWSLTFFDNITHQVVSLSPNDLKFSPLHLWPTHKLNEDGPLFYCSPWKGTYNFSWCCLRHCCFRGKKCHVSQVQTHIFLNFSSSF
jgi:hypothetical protein